MKRKNNQDDREILWLNKSGTLSLQGRGEIQPRQRFRAKPEEIPSIFQDTVVPLEELPGERGEEPETGEEPNLEPQHRGGGYYDVVDTNSDKALNEKAMRLDDAKQFIEELKGEAEPAEE